MNASVLRALAREITTAQVATARAQVATDWDHSDQASSVREPPTPLLSYRVIEITVGAESPAVGKRLGNLAWPPGSIPGPAQVSVRPP